MGSITENAATETERDERKQTQRYLHDLYTKQVMSRLANAVSWLKFVLPEWYSINMDWNTLTVLPTVYVSKKLTQRLGDMAYRATLLDSDEQLWFLVEHQSRPDPRMLVRAMEYGTSATGLYVDGQHHTDGDGDGDLDAVCVGHARQPQHAVRTPAIVNAVLFSGPTPSRWGYELKSTHTTGLSTDTLKWIGDDLLQCRIYLDDAVNCSIEDLRARPMTVAMRMLTIAHKIAVRDGSILEKLQEQTPLLRELFTGADGDAELECLQSYLQGMRTDRQTEVDPVIRQLGSRAEEIVLSTAEKIERKSRAEGRAELLLEQLSYRFGRPSPGVAARIHNGTPEELWLWGRRVLTAETINEVFDN